MIYFPSTAHSTQNSCVAIEDCFGARLYGHLMIHLWVVSAMHVCVYLNVYLWKWIILVHECVRAWVCVYVCVCMCVCEFIGCSCYQRVFCLCPCVHLHRLCMCVLTHICMCGDVYARLQKNCAGKLFHRQLI